MKNIKDLNLTPFLTALKDVLNKYKERNNFTYFDYFEVSVHYGSKYAKVFRHEIKNGKDFGQRNLVGFVDGDGNIYKAASFAAPAKGIRGNINSDKNGMEAINSSGFVVYLR